MGVVPLSPASPALTLRPEEDPVAGLVAVGLSVVLRQAKRQNVSPVGTRGAGRVEPLCPLVVAQPGSLWHDWARGPHAVGTPSGCPYLGVAPGGQRLAAALAA